VTKDNRSRTPKDKAFLEFMRTGWSEMPAIVDTNKEAIQSARQKREELMRAFPNVMILIEAGSSKMRSNDTHYRFRPSTEFTQLTSWGSATVEGSLLVLDTKTNSTKLFIRPTADKDSDEFFANTEIGEFWVGPRPTIEQVEKQLEIEVADITDFDAGQKYLTVTNGSLAEFLSEQRIIKNSWEIAEIKKAVDATKQGFENLIYSIPKAGIRGERVIEAAFYEKARLLGHDLGYETISAAGNHANILHWTKNDGDIDTDDLVLVDAGVEVDSLFTADITRTMPVSGKFSHDQKEVYEIVLEAADAAFAVCKPGNLFRDMHNEAMKVIAKHCERLGIIPVTAQQSLLPENQHHRRWMVHGTGHHLGLDVHDCAQARKEMYLDTELKPGMVFTIEPGLYFHLNDRLAPPRFRGIGVRIEDNIAITETGHDWLSKDIPRTVDEVETWMQSVWDGN
jgi:Xaa-Pro aminopeptidase